MKNAINEFKAMKLADKVFTVCALAFATGYVINAFKR